MDTTSLSAVVETVSDGSLEEEERKAQKEKDNRSSNAQSNASVVPNRTGKVLVVGATRVSIDIRASYKEHSKRGEVVGRTTQQVGA